MSFGILDKRLSQRGIKGDPKKVLVSAVGGQVFTSGSYKVHMFTSTDAFQVLYKSTSSAVFDYVVVGGGQSGQGSQPFSVGGAGGSGSYRVGYSENFNRFNLRTSYTVTVGGAGSHSSISTNSTAISSAGGSIGSGGSGGLGDSTSPECTGPVIDGECTTNCEQCGGQGATNGGDGQGGVLAYQNPLVLNGPYFVDGYGITVYVYYGSGAGGGAGGGYEGGGGHPNGGAGGYPVGNGNDGLPNSGVGGGGAGGQEDGQYCNNTSECTAQMTSGPSDATPASGGTGGSGIVFIRYKFQE